MDERLIGWIDGYLSSLMRINAKNHSICASVFHCDLDEANLPNSLACFLHDNEMIDELDDIKFGEISAVTDWVKFIEVEYHKFLNFDNIEQYIKQINDVAIWDVVERISYLTENYSINHIYELTAKLEGMNGSYILIPVGNEYLILTMFKLLIVD